MPKILNVPGSYSVCPARCVDANLAKGAEDARHSL